LRRFRFRRQYGAVADDAVEQPFVGGSAQFFKRTEIRRAKLQRALRRCRSVGRVGERAPGGQAYWSLAMTTAL